MLHGAALLENSLGVTGSTYVLIHLCVRSGPLPGMVCNDLDDDCCQDNRDDAAVPRCGTVLQYSNGLSEGGHLRQTGINRRINAIMGCLYDVNT